MVGWVNLSRMERYYLEVLSVVAIFLGFRRWLSVLGFNIGRRCFAWVLIVMSIVIFSIFLNLS